jgi:hypothetical protein
MIDTGASNIFILSQEPGKQGCLYDPSASTATILATNHQTPWLGGEVTGDIVQDIMSLGEMDVRLPFSSFLSHFLLDPFRHQHLSSWHRQNFFHLGMIMGFWAYAYPTPQPNHRYKIL